MSSAAARSGRPTQYSWHATEVRTSAPNSSDAVVEQMQTSSWRLAPRNGYDSLGNSAAVGSITATGSEKADAVWIRRTDCQSSSVQQILPGRCELAFALLLPAVESRQQNRGNLNMRR